MRKLTGILFFVIIAAFQVFSQKENLYDAKADGIIDFNEALKKAKKENKNVLVQIGGNWCPWCYRYHEFIKNNPKLDSITNSSYIVLHVNYSPENKNLELMKKLDIPQRFGFPVFVITDENGKRIHTQNSWYLEQESSYDIKKTEDFLKNWSKKALDISNNK